MLTDAEEFELDTLTWRAVADLPMTSQDCRRLHELEMKATRQPWYIDAVLAILLACAITIIVMMH